MKYATHLRKLFDGLHLSAEDLLHLESFQIKYLPDRVPNKEFAALLRAYPFVQRFLISKQPTIESFINTVLKENKAINDKKLIEAYCDELLWEIAELIIFTKYPEIFDNKVNFTWEINEIILPELLKGKVVADVGAGSGMLSFLLAKHAKLVYAIEPLASFQNFIREKATKEKYNNINVINGFLDAIPLPDQSVDFLFTSNALGWNFEKEQKEIERVIKPNGEAIHLMRAIDKEIDNPFHAKLVSGDWKYKYQKYSNASGLKIKYFKTLNTTSAD